jgi:hypothetical protein
MTSGLRTSQGTASFLLSQPFHSSDNEDRVALYQGNNQTEYAADQRSASVENPARAILMTPLSCVPIPRFPPRSSWRA